MRCSRTSPCLSCKMRGDECVWIGAAPNGTANEDEVELTQMEVNRLKKLVDLLLTRLEQQDAEIGRLFATKQPPTSATMDQRSHGGFAEMNNPPPPPHRSNGGGGAGPSTKPYDPRYPHPDPPIHHQAQGGQRPFQTSSSSRMDADIVVEDGGSSGGGDRGEASTSRADLGGTESGTPRDSHDSSTRSTFYR